MSSFYNEITFYINNKLYDRLTYVEIWHQKYLPKLYSNSHEYMKFIEDNLSFENLQKRFDYILNDDFDDDKEILEQELKELILTCFPNLNFTCSGDSVVDEIINNVIKPTYNEIIRSLIFLTFHLKK